MCQWKKYEKDKPIVPWKKQTFTIFNILVNLSIKLSLNLNLYLRNKIEGINKNTFVKFEERTTILLRELVNFFLLKKLVIGQIIKVRYKKDLLWSSQVNIVNIKKRPTKLWCFIQPGLMPIRHIFASPVIIY